MDQNQPPSKQMHAGDGGEDRLLRTLTETVEVLGAVGRRRGHPDGGTGKGGAEEEAAAEPVEEDWKLKALGVLRALSVAHWNRAAEWGEALRECACSFHDSPLGGAKPQHPSATDFSATILSVARDVEVIENKLSAIVTKLDTEILRLAEEERRPEGAELHADQEPHASEKTPEVKLHDAHELKSRPAMEVEDGRRSGRSSDGGSSMRSDRFEPDANEIETKEAPQDKGQTAREENVSCGEEMTKGKEKETRKEPITVGLSDQDGGPELCFVRAPPGVAGVLSCEEASALSRLMVIGSEELVSRVLRVKAQDGAGVRFPVTVVVPFCARYRGNYRSIAVKVVDEAKRSSYITPVTTEGTYGGQRGSFAEVKVYSLGLFAVVSCLRRDHYTVPKRGVSHKLPADPRICLNYLPGAFAAPVVAQSMVQPVDAVLLAAVKSKSEAYHWVASTSPLLYLTHPSSQPLRRPLTVTLPCPPNPDKRREARGRGEETRSDGASQDRDRPSRRGIRPAASVTPSKERGGELLSVLGSRNEEWSVLEGVAVRNQQNGLVAFELTETFDRLLVVRLLSPVQPCYLASLAAELEGSACLHRVTVVLRRRRDEPHAVLVAALPSRDLGWELSKLQAQGYDGLAETSSEICMWEGDQLLLRLCGNITSAETQNDGVLRERLTFHSQRKNNLVVHLTEVDPFGNYSSPHYKGTAVFYKVARGQAEWRSDQLDPADSKLPGEPVCKLPLTLPKKVRTTRRYAATRAKPCEETDSLSDSLLLWLSGELSEEEIALLALSLRLRRSAAQLVKLRAGDSASARAFNVLAMWRRELPAAAAHHQPKASQLARCLAKSGRPDLARELLLRQAAASKQCALK